MARQTWWSDAGAVIEVKGCFMVSMLKASAQRVQRELAAKGVVCPVVELEKNTRSAREAADAVGCEISQIAKSLVFEGRVSGKAYLVIASGANRVDANRLAGMLGEPVAMAHPEVVRTVTGYAIGGVPPVGHTSSLTGFIDQDLMHCRQIWAAAGTPNALFQLTPAQLLDITGYPAVPIAE